MNRRQDTERKVKELRITTRAALDERIISDATSALVRALGRASPNERKSHWRTIMKSKWTKLAAAAAVLAVAGLWIVIDRPAAPAYAIEDTLAANRALRSFHIRIDPSGNGIGEAWAQLDGRGELVRLRMDFPSTEDGPKVVVWEADQALVWFKAKKSAVLLREKKILEQFPRMLSLFDPKVAMEELSMALSRGKASLESCRPSAGGDSVTLTVAFPDQPGRKDLVKVDARSKLVMEVERRRVKGGVEELASRHEYLDYNLPADPATFELDLPLEVVRVDQANQEIGLAKGGLQDGEVAVKVAQGFFEALIAKDYAGAGKLLEGLPAEKMRELFGGTEYLRIVSIGTPRPHPDPRTRFLQVPCQVEVRVNGESSVKDFLPNIRAVYGRPDRWTIGGGI